MSVNLNSMRKRLAEIAGEKNADEEQLNSEDLENCDEYALPDWWDNGDYELRPIKKGEKKLNELQVDREYKEKLNNNTLSGLYKALSVEADKGYPYFYVNIKNNAVIVTPDDVYNFHPLTIEFKSGDIIIWEGKDIKKTRVIYKAKESFKNALNFILKNIMNKK